MNSPELRKALAAVIDPQGWSVEQVMEYAEYLCLCEYWRRIDGFVINEAKKLRGRANTELAQAKGHIEKHLGPGATSSGLWRHTFFDAAIAAASRKSSRPRELRPALVKLFKTAGLGTADAKYHAAELEQQLASIYERKAPWKTPPQRG